jgi:hypothetical protein
MRKSRDNSSKVRKKSKRTENSSEEARNFNSILDRSTVNEIVNQRYHNAASDDVA